MPWRHRKRGSSELPSRVDGTDERTTTVRGSTVRHGRVVVGESPSAAHRSCSGEQLALSRLSSASFPFTRALAALSPLLSEVLPDSVVLVGLQAPESTEMRREGVVRVFPTDERDVHK